MRHWLYPVKVLEKALEPRRDCLGWGYIEARIANALERCGVNGSRSGASYRTDIPDSYDIAPVIARALFEAYEKGRRGEPLSKKVP